MNDAQRAYIAIDLKSYYASVECVERGLDPLDTNLVVADESRSTGTICLAVSPPLKAQGVPGRPRLFEVIQKVKEINGGRKYRAPGRRLAGESASDAELKSNPSLALSYITAMPRMGLYIQCSTRIYQVYLRFIAPEDIVVYSIDEVFIDVTPYLGTYGITAHDLAMEMVRAVLRETGVTATAGIGTNLYLAKVAMDIVAKKMPADKDGVRIAELDESAYQLLLFFLKTFDGTESIADGFGISDDFLLFCNQLIVRRDKCCPDFFLRDVRRPTLVAAVFLVAAVDDLAVAVGRVPYFRAVPAPAVGAFDFVGENAHAAVPRTALRASGKFRLHHVEHCRADDGFVIALHIVLRDFALVLLYLLLQEIHRKLLLKKGVALVFLIREHPSHRLLVPHLLARRRLDALACQFCSDGVRCHALKEQPENEFHGFRLLLVHHNFSCLSVLVQAKKAAVGEADLAVSKRYSFFPSWQTVKYIPAKK